MLSDLFYSITFTGSIVASTIIIVLSFAIVATIIAPRPCRTIKNLVLANTAVATCIFAVFQIILAAYGYRADASHIPPACVFQAYFYIGVVVLVIASYSVQSISSFFFAVLYRHKFLLSWRIHWLLIAANYLYAVVGPIPLFFIEDDLGFDERARLCLPSPKVWRGSLYCVFMAYLVPLNTVFILYAIIFYQTRQSGRRVAAFGPDTAATDTRTTAAKTMTRNMQREMKLMKKILILVGFVLMAGLPCSMIVMWQAVIAYPQPPEPLYLLSVVNITVVYVIKIAVLLFMNKEVKDIVLASLKKICFL